MRSIWYLFRYSHGAELATVSATEWNGRIRQRYIRVLTGVIELYAYPNKLLRRKSFCSISKEREPSTSDSNKYKTRLRRKFLDDMWITCSFTVWRWKMLTGRFLNQGMLIFKRLKPVRIKPRREKAVFCIMWSRQEGICVAELVHSRELRFSASIGENEVEHLRWQQNTISLIQKC